MSVSVVIKGSEKVVGQYTWWSRAVNGLILRSLVEVSGKVNAAYLGVQWLLCSPGSCCPGCKFCLLCAPIKEVIAERG